MIRSVILVLVIGVSVAGSAIGCARGCAAALLEGVLTEQDGDLVVIRGDGVAESVAWTASGYRVRDDTGVRVVLDGLGLVKAREGDFVRLGGGESEPGRWGICGMFELGGGRQP